MSLSSSKLENELISALGNLDAGGGKKIRDVIVGDTLSSFCNVISSTIISHINRNAEAVFSVGSITGTCPSGGGPLTLGAATGGKIL